jgi:PAS domain S-box-containing protein
MKPSVIPDNETDRLRTLQRYEILDTEPEPAFDALTALVAHILKVPIALVSLVDADRQWFKSRHGLDATQTPRDVSFCGHVVAEAKPVVVCDALKDDRFFDNPLVTGGPQVRFYAGYPLKTPEGFVLGALCGVDRQPHEITREQLEMLGLLAMQVVDQMELRRKNRMLEASRSVLETSENRLRAVVDTATDPIITIDSGGLIESVNSAALGMFGYASHELLGRNISLLMPSPHRERHDRHIADYLRIGIRKVIGMGREVEARRKDGSMVSVELAVSEMVFGGRRLFTGILRDISERKKVERLQAEFVSTVSHELRTPLTSIRGSLGLVAGGMTGSQAPETRELVDIALNNCDRLVRLINDILDMEKMQSGRMEFRLRTVELAAAVRQAMAANEAFAAAHRTRLVLLGEPASGEVVVDEDRLAQVLTNLISNAAKFTPEDSVVEVSVSQAGERLRVGVRDHGPGISAEFKDRVFQRFSQADSSDSRQKGGTGLGLNISKAIVEQLNGRIGFEDAPGGGTCFFFELPRVPRAEQGGQPDRADRVLVCEDDPEAALVLKKMLENARMSAHVAPTIERARQLLAQFRYRAVTLDLALADGDGSVLIGEMRGSAAHHNTPVIVLTGMGAAARSYLGPAAVSVADILIKPVDETRLLNAIHTATCRVASRHLRLLHVEDDADLRLIVKKHLPAEWDVREAGTLAGARALLTQASFDVVLLDLALPDGGGEALLDAVGGAQVIIFSANEISSRLARRVGSALTKSQANVADLCKTILELVSKVGAERGTA